MRLLSQSQANKIRNLPTLHQGQSDDLKKETPKRRIWVSRVENDSKDKPLVSYEEFFPFHGRWETVAKS